VFARNDAGRPWTGEKGVHVFKMNEVEQGVQKVSFVGRASLMGDPLSSLMMMEDPLWWGSKTSVQMFANRSIKEKRATACWNMYTIIV